MVFERALDKLGQNGYCVVPNSFRVRSRGSSFSKAIFHVVSEGANRDANQNLRDFIHGHMQEAGAFVDCQVVSSAKGRRTHSVAMTFSRGTGAVPQEVVDAARKKIGVQPGYEKP